jgi:hypothetical protein
MNSDWSLSSTTVNRGSSTASRSSPKGGVFATLCDPEVFRRAKVNEELGIVTWDDEVDIAPETAYSLATGTPLPEWAEEE